MTRTGRERFRLGCLYIAVCLFFSVAAARLVHLQIVNAGKYRAIVDRQSSGRVKIPATRGVLYDRKGRTVASNVERASLYAYPRNKAQLHQVSRYLDSLFGYKPGTSLKKCGLRVNRFRWVRRRIADDLAQAVMAQAPRGLHLRMETQRAYPFGLIGKQILGFTDIDNRGMSGIELGLDSMLSGDPGYADYRRDGLANTYRVNETALIPPVPGRTLVLTVDFGLQEIVERELQKGVEEFHARTGMAVMVDCYSGEILSMAHYDPTEKHRDRPVKLRTTSDLFEPGSSFKAITTAAILDAGLAGFSDTVFCEEGKWRLGRRTLHDDKEHGWLTFREIFELSSNIGIGKHALELGGEELHNATRRFGFGAKTGIPIPSEAAGSVAVPNRWSEYMTAALAMGHGISVTSLQMAMAFATVANGGQLLRPRLIYGMVDTRHRLSQRYECERIERVMTTASADTLRAWMRGVVQRGTAEAVQSSIVSIAGKTGTAQIPNSERGGYYRNKFTASFGGFFPAERPQVAGIVVLIEPKPVHYGGWTAGPVFRRIAEKFVTADPDRFGSSERILAETDRATQRTVVLPDLVGSDMRFARSVAAAYGFRVRPDSARGEIGWQFPSPGSLMFQGDNVLVRCRRDDSALVMFDMAGLSVREASALLETVGISYSFYGNGRVVSQSIKPGKNVFPGEICRLTCRPM